MRRFFIKSAIFVLLPIFAGEGLWHFRANHVPPAWYLGTPWLIGRQPLDAVFVGSSRVGAAINDTVFSKVLATYLRRNVTALNMGKGYSTLAEHYFGLRLMIRSHPANFRGCTVFIEAPDGLPDASTWSDTWVHSEWTSLLGPMLNARDVVRMWWDSETRLADKISVTAGAATITIYAASKIRGELAAQGDLVLQRLLSRETARPRMDLAEAAGIRVDSAGVAATRSLAVEFYAREAENQRPVSSWDVTVARAITDLVNSSGGHVVFYTMPVSSVQEKSLRTPVRISDRAGFHDALRAWNAMYLPLSFPTDDEDFPDLWHLRQSRSFEFSRSLAAAYAGHGGLQQPITGLSP
jgi:hypothetical protein